MNRKKLRKAGVILFLLVMCILVGCKKKMTVQDYLDLGEKYLTELNYEEAIVAFGKAIELEPRNTEAYLKLADVYDVQEDYEMAAQVLAQGYEATQSPELQKRKEIYENILENQALMNDLLARVKMQDRENIWELQQGDAYQNFVSKLDRVLTRDCGDGKWFQIYPCGHCYYGGMENGKRSGLGIWCTYDYVEEVKEYDSCMWQDDYPNGTGEKWSVCLPVPWDLFHTEIQFKDGYYHGNIQEDYISNQGESFEEHYSYECSEGTPAEVPDLHVSDEDGMMHHGKDMYCIYSDAEISHYATRGYKKGMLHARKGMDDTVSMAAYTEAEITDARESIEAEIQEMEDWEIDEQEMPDLQMEEETEGGHGGVYEFGM